MTLQINNDCSSLSSENSFKQSSKKQQIFKIQKSPDLKDSRGIQFPSWLQGHWQHLNVQQNQLIFKDQSSLKSYRMKLISYEGEKFIVHSRSQCGEEKFNCLWIRKLDTNIAEFQLSSKSEMKLTTLELCDEQHFEDNARWLTISSESSLSSVRLHSILIFNCRKRCD